MEAMDPRARQWHPPLAYHCTIIIGILAMGADEKIGDARERNAGILWWHSEQ